jgi:hypothetical protein
VLVYLSWARANPVGWEAHEVTKSQDIRSLPNKGEPTAPFDPLAPDADDPGWLVGVNVQGVAIIGFDHIGPSIGTDGRILIHAWNDDPVDWPDPWGITWSFANPRIDERVSGGMNTEQYLTVYDSLLGQSGHEVGYYGKATTGGPVTYLPWADFVEPGPANLVRHGIWITDPVLWELHLVRMQQSSPGWREYIVP